jgi:hypothetical protein
VILCELIPIIKAEKLDVKLTLRDHLIKDLSFFRRQNSLVPRIAKKVSLIINISRVILKIPRVETEYNRNSVFVDVKKEKVFELRLKKFDLRSDKLAKILYT